MRSRRITGSGSFLILLNVVFLFGNGVLWIQNSRHAPPDSAPEKTHASPFLEALTSQKNLLSRRAQLAEEQLGVVRRKYAQLEEELTRCAQKSKLPQGDVDEIEQPTPCPAKPDQRRNEIVGNGNPDRPFLVIGIPTVPRKREEGIRFKDSLLFRTLNSMVAEIQGTAFEPTRGTVISAVMGADGAEMETVPDTGGGVRIVVMNNRPGSHTMFTAVAEYFRDEKKIHFIDFLERPTGKHGKFGTPRYEDNAGKPFSSEFIGSSKEKPTPKVRRQTLDVVSLLDAVVGRSKYFYFTEDDFEFCGTTMTALQYVLHKASIYQPRPDPWTGIRCSFGLNGILMHNDALRTSEDGKAIAGSVMDNKNHNNYPDLTHFRDYLLEHFNRRPPDHLVVEWYARESQQSKQYFGSKRTVAAFRYNVAKHAGGHQSTLREESAWSFPGCFTELIAPQVFEVEAWNPVECPQDDLWPCPKSRGGNGFGAKASDRQLGKLLDAIPPSDHIYRGPPILWNADEDAAVSKHRKIFVGGKEARQQ